MITIGVYGGTGSGKTTIVSKIVSEFPTNEIQVISQDSYYKDTSHLTFEERCALNFDHPDAIDFPLLYQHVNSLKNGENIEQPVYSFETHNRTKETVTVVSKKILIIEGILILNYPKLRSLFDLKIYIDADSDMRMERRVSRDISERGRTPEEVLNRYLNTLKPMHKQFIEPMKVHADITLENHQNTPLNLSELIDKIKTLSK
ncbi:MAG: uridine kinase [Flavobacteriaceae bacterium]|jgi:uridine kinase|nr:uridine kinase [Flavobacteriaceae bacterium]MDG2484519.1 uridine kinase [Flavobacteriaceae bacterium]NCF42838.1 uridine kinase [Bacteroidota bacterium]|tara:strand:+ start:1152 stop:1760 length:609 start_codon:yes stop_codon:yes gene_type:complete